ETSWISGDRRRCPAHQRCRRALLAASPPDLRPGSSTRV
ncbi:hypothetical protein AVDCRST_MAG84-459, partial [uncultured Microcoleus sp.]